MVKNKPLKIGFDLDGVILYNPMRIFRPFASFLRPYIFHRKNRKFYFPKTRLEKFIWRLLHHSSLWIAPGVEDILNLSKKGKIEAYIITARYSFLKDDFTNWIKKIDPYQYLNASIYNKNDEQPHLFKEKIIDKLNLDVFVEDNWGIVNYLSKKKPEKTKIYWIYNLFDKNISYIYKKPNLKEVFKALKKEIL